MASVSAWWKKPAAQHPGLGLAVPLGGQRGVQPRVLHQPRHRLRALLAVGEHPQVPRPRLVREHQPGAAHRLVVHPAAVRAARTVLGEHPGEQVTVVELHAVRRADVRVPPAAPLPGDPPQRGHTPPSMSTVVAVRKPDDGRARWTTAAPTSSGVPPADRDARLHGLLRLGGGERVVEGGALDEAGRDGVDRDAGAPELLGQALGEAAHTGLGRRVGHRAGAAAVVGGQRGHRDDAVGRRLLQVGDGGAHGAERGRQIGGDDLVEVVVGHLGDGGPADQMARVADQDVQAAEEAGRLLDEPVHVGGHRDIGLEGLGPAAQRLDRGDRLRGLVGGGVVVDGDVRGQASASATAMARPMPWPAPVTSAREPLRSADME